MDFFDSVINEAAQAAGSTKDAMGAAAKSAGNVVQNAGNAAAGAAKNVAVRISRKSVHSYMAVLGCHNITFPA